MPPYIPTSFNPKTNPNNPANIISSIAALIIVKNNAIVPFPILWNKFPATTPIGINNIKKDWILITSAILCTKYGLFDKYAKMCDKGSAKVKKIITIIMEDINPNLSA